jgi:hypothetical protein
VQDFLLTAAGLLFYNQSRLLRGRKFEIEWAKGLEMLVCVGLPEAEKSFRRDSSNRAPLAICLAVRRVPEEH